MVTLAATGKVENGGPVVITATTLTGGADHPAPATDAWEQGRAAYFTAMADEGAEFEPSIEDDSFWIRTGC